MEILEPVLHALFIFLRTCAISVKRLWEAIGAIFSPTYRERFRVLWRSNWRGKAQIILLPILWLIDALLVWLLVVIVR